MALARALAVEPRGAAARRAVRRARRQRARGAARVAAPPARRGPRDHGVRHPRPGGGDGGRRPDRGDATTGEIEQVGRAARALRPARERVRDGLRRPGRRSVGGDARAPARRRRSPTTPSDGGERGAWSSASCTSASRCGSSWRSATASSVVGRSSTRAEADELELRDGRDRLRCGDGLAAGQRLTQASGSSAELARRRAAARRAARSASVTCSTTARRLARTRDPDVAAACSAAPWYSTLLGRARRARWRAGPRPRG